MLKKRALMRTSKDVAAIAANSFSTYVGLARIAEEAVPVSLNDAGSAAGAGK